MGNGYLKSVGLRWLGGLTAVAGVGSLELVRYAANSQPLSQAVLNNSPLLIIFAGLLVGSLFVLVRRLRRLGWISYLIGAAAGPLILWGLGSYLEGPSLAWASLSIAVVVGFTPCPGLAPSMRGELAKAIRRGGREDRSSAAWPSSNGSPRQSGRS